MPNAAAVQVCDRTGCTTLLSQFAINTARVLTSDTYLLVAILLARMNSSTDITSEQKQNSSQHNESVNLARKMSANTQKEPQIATI